MAKRVAAAVGATGEKAAQPVQRLCNEIQLFDLCELEKCGHKQGLYCTSPELLSRFEAIAEEDERPVVAGHGCEEDDDALESGDGGYADDYDDDRFDDEGYGEDLEDQ